MSEWIGDECDPQAISVDTPTSFYPHAPLMASSPRISQPPRLGRLAERTQYSKLRCNKSTFGLPTKPGRWPASQETKTHRVKGSSYLHSMSNQVRKRAGVVFALVGPHFSSSYSACSVSSDTGRGCHLLNVRASRKRMFNAASFSDQSGVFAITF
jgi:hypothetical protein